MKTKHWLVVTCCLDERNARTIAKILQRNGQSCMVHKPGSDLTDRVVTYWNNDEKSVEEHSI